MLAHKQLDPTTLELLIDWRAEELRLMVLLEPMYRAVDRAQARIVAQALDLDPATFRVDDPIVTEQLSRTAAERAVLITETSRRQLRELIAQGQSDGLTTQEIADSIRHLFDVTWAGRAETVARTELGEAQRVSAIARYRQSGKVDRVYIRDGEDDEPCRSRNGTTVPLSEAPGLAHPNCVLTLVPVVREGA